MEKSKIQLANFGYFRLLRICDQDFEIFVDYLSGKFVILMIRILPKNIGKIIVFFLFCQGVSIYVYPQGTSISGVVNQYRHVTAIGGTTNVTVTDASVFHQNDTVLLIQMKGAVINVTESGSYGGYRESSGTPGAYEFLIVASVNYGSNIIAFTRDIINTYDVSGMVQLIRVPSYGQANVTAKLTCQAWDSTTKTGGVLAVIVGGRLSLNANIDVAGLGFRGGTPFTGNAICTVTDQLTYDKFSYNNSWLNSGFKGEGIADRAYVGVGDEPSVFPQYAKGKGANFTSGGGGNGRFAGGGGGAGYGAGGNGGVEISYCGAGNQGGSGVGGRQVKYTDLDGNIMMGSGGGASTYLSGGTATQGGKGGGVVIIVCDTLIGNSKSVLADGEKPSGNSSGNAGAGGGGGGGTIALCQRTFSTDLSLSELYISANGGNGGDASNQFGEGGGGGGGFILSNDISLPANLHTTYKSGSAGSRTGGSLGATAGQEGKILTSFVPVLNGFLFNSIVDSLTNNKSDSVCSNMQPPIILGTKPVGGSGSYTFTWQDSSSLTSGWTNISGWVGRSDAQDYRPSVLAVTTSFRRIVYSAGATTITDISKPVRIIVHQAITNNHLINPDEICYNGNPAVIQQLFPDIVVPTSYTFFTWQDSSSTAGWGASLASTKVYDPPSPLTMTKWYRRTVRSGSCVDSSAKVKVTVLPLISNNSIGTAQDICNGSSFNNLTGTDTPVLTGGDGAFIFKWENRINTTTWSIASGTSDQKNYNPVEQPQRLPSNEYDYRRIVFSGDNNVCADTSTVVHLRDFPGITNNSISIASRTVCYGYTPAAITGSTPANGNGVFTYTWQDSTNSTTQWQNISGYVNVTSKDFQPPVLTSTTSYRRITISYPCDSVSNSIKIIVQPLITNNNIYLKKLGGSTDTTVCSGQHSSLLTGTVISGATYQWLYSTGTVTPSVISGATLSGYSNLPALSTTTNYWRQVTLGACVDTSDIPVTVNVLPPLSNFEIEATQSLICENSIPGQITGDLPAGGSGSYLYLWEQSSNNGSNWGAAEGDNTSVNYSPPALDKTMVYRRSVTSGLAGCCTVTSSAVEIVVKSAPESPVSAGSDTAIYSIDRSYTMKALPAVVQGESGYWTVLDPGTASITTVSDPETEVRNLSRGQNFFTWTITNGVCSLSDSVIIQVMRDFIPQGFSPNNDAFNNEFIIEGLNLDEETAELKILNGAGTIVFSTSNRDGQKWTNWDGRNNKGIELQEGTYYYLLKVSTKDRGVVKKSGFVVLKRY